MSIVHCLFRAFVVMIGAASVVVAADVPRVAGQPTLWLVGDSTVKVSDKDQQGWGTPLIAMFDPAKVRVINRAIGGRSSRTFITEGRWDIVLNDAERGDVVLLQFGHNDGGPLSGDNRERGSLRGTGDDTKDVVLTLGANNGKAETVHTYGWYLRKYVADAKAKGITAIVCSPIPRCPRPNDRLDPDAAPAGYRLWAQQSAETAGASYIDLQGIILKTYAGQTSAALQAAYFGNGEYTHTSRAGAWHNAECVVDGLRRLPGAPLIDFLKPAAERQPPAFTAATMPATMPNGPPPASSKAIRPEHGDIARGDELSRSDLTDAAR